MEDLDKILNDEDFTWIKVKRFVDDSNLPLEERFHLLEKHHLNETKFLINKCRDLARTLKTFKDGLNV